MTGKLNGKTAVITGGAAGMGESHVRLFIEEGAQVVFTDINAEKGQTLAETLGSNALFVRQDVADEKDWQNVVDQAVETFGKIDILVNNAGVSTVLSVENSTLEDYQKIININQISCFLGIRAVIPAMKKAGRGSIINISSINGLVAGAFGYTDTKFAVRGMTKAAAKELARYKIRVNSVHPGIINTPMVQNSEAFDKIQAYAQSIPLQRMAEPAEVSRLVLFLASDDSAYCTGTEFKIDGGLTA